MPKAKPSASVALATVGLAISFSVNDEDFKGKIIKVDKKTGDFEVETDDGKSFEFEADEFHTVEVIEEEQEEKPEKTAKKPAKPDKAAKKPAREEGSSGTRSLASAWRSTEKAARTGGGGFPIGNWSAVVVGGECAVGDKGTSASIGFIGTVDEEVKDQLHRKFYGLFDEEGNPKEEQIGYFKADLSSLGLDDDDIDSLAPDTDDLEEFAEAIEKGLKKIGKVRPWVSVRVVKPKKEGYSNNLYVQGLMADQDEKPEIEEDNIPY